VASGQFHDQAAFTPLPILSQAGLAPESALTLEEVKFLDLPVLEPLLSFVQAVASHYTCN
jgi:hypothetical protein